MRVVGYVRVSSRNRQHQEESAPEQERAICAWCKANGHRLVRVYRDVGVSGANGLQQREGLPDAEAAIVAGEADGLVVRELDRLHRDMLVQEQVFADLWRIRPEVEVYSTKPAEAQHCRRDDLEDPSRRMIRQVLGAVAEYVRAQTVARLRAGKRRKAEAGGYVGGQPAYGTRAEDKALVLDPAEQAAIRRVAELHQDGASLRSIAATLEAEGHRPKRGDHWHPQTVAVMAPVHHHHGVDRGVHCGRQCAGCQEDLRHLVSYAEAGLQNHRVRFACPTSRSPGVYRDAERSLSIACASRPKQEAGHHDGGPRTARRSGLAPREPALGRLAPG